MPFNNFNGSFPYAYNGMSNMIPNQPINRCAQKIMRCQYLQSIVFQRYY